MQEERAFSLREKLKEIQSVQSEMGAAAKTAKNSMSIVKSILSDESLADAVATFIHNIHNSLVWKGYTDEQALQIVTHLNLGSITLNRTSLF